MDKLIGNLFSHEKKKHNNDKPFVTNEPTCEANLEIEIEKLENKTFNVHILSDDTEMESQHLSKIDFDTLKECVSNAMNEFKIINNNDFSKTECKSVFPTPTETDLLKMDKNSIYGLSYALKHNVRTESEFGDATLNMIHLLLDHIHDNMADNDKLSNILTKKQQKGDNQI